ncbi:MAG: pyridoxamine 5-phosphate oxidase-related FMN-binding protein, partial [Firmicutes bacterium]|nr:pyridoxamine 5-phosphate oxidase-related FMN-binding protein [Bacillota bacterium]
DIDDYGFVVICSPVYSESIDEEIIVFARENAGILRQRKVALICVCIAEQLAGRYLEPIRGLLGDSVVFQSAAAGHIDMEKLSGKDRELMEGFCSMTGASTSHLKVFDNDSLVELALRIKEIKDEGIGRIEDDLLRKHIEDFLKGHNTCVLATGNGGRVRATPIEYMFIDGSIYMLSEGGEKFANLILNPSVSIGINNPYKSMSDLAGMQISGKAGLVGIGSEEYKYVLGNRGLDFDKISSLPMALNLLKIDICKIEFLWSGFGKLGYDVKQILAAY